MRKLHITFIKHNKIVALIQAILYFRNIKEIFTHVQLGFSDSTVDFSAESSGMEWVDKPTAKDYPDGLEVYEVPVKADKENIDTKLQYLDIMFNEFVNQPYDFYLYFLWALNIFTVFIVPVLVTMGVLNFTGMIVVSVLLAIIYIPLRLLLKKKSMTSWACAEISSMLLEKIGIDFGYAENYRTASPYIMRKCVKFAGWKRVL